MTALDSSSLKFWESVAEWGFRMVFIGVVGEGAEIIAKLYFKKSFKKYEHSWDIFSGICWLILVVGLAIEFKGTHNVTLIADSENARLTNEAALARREAGQANERAANTESNNLVLQSNVDELEIRLRKQLRKISLVDRDEFIDFLKNCPHKKPIQVFVEKSIFEGDFETRNYARQIRGMLDDAGLGGTNEKIHQLENFSMVLFTGYTNTDTPFYTVVYGQEGNISWPGLKITFDGSKGEVVVNYFSDDVSCLGYVNAAFKKIGIVPSITIRTDWDFVKTNGDWAIFIPGRF
jgi:hypothetical protein